MARTVAERADAVTALAEVFRRHGFEGATLSRIAAETGLGKGSLYHFFPGGKDEMADAVLADVRAWFEAHVFAPLEDAAIPADEAIERMLEASADYFRRGGRICLMGVFALDVARDRRARAIHDYFERWRSALADALRRLGHDEEAARARATRIVAGVQGAIVLSRALDDPVAFDETLAGLRELRRVTAPPIPPATLPRS